MVPYLINDMTYQLQIRDYHPNDRDFVIAIMELNVPQYFAVSEVADLSDYLEYHIEKYFVVLIDGKIIGAGGINFENNGAVISWDFIDPAFHGKGIGRKLLQHRIQLIKSMEDIATITVRTSQLTYKFYEKSGFVLKNMIKDYWAKGFDLYGMEYKPQGNY